MIVAENPGATGGLQVPAVEAQIPAPGQRSNRRPSLATSYESLPVTVILHCCILNFTLTRPQTSQQVAEPLESGHGYDKVWQIPAGRSIMN